MASRIIAIAFIALVLAGTAYALAPPKVLLDLAEFYVPARMILSGQGAGIYRYETYKAAVDAILPGAVAVVLYAPPPGLPLLLPVGLLPVELLRWFWWSFLLICMLASLLVL